MMLSVFFRVKILTVVVFINLIHRAESEVYVDGNKALKRDSRIGVAYANFVAHKFSRLDLVPLVSALVQEIRECGKLCVDHVSCYSFNLAAFRDNVERKILCQLLQSDKYNTSSMFGPSPIFHHFSIKSPCSSDPCVNGATCVAEYENNDYQCACAPGYVGKHCEIAFLNISIRSEGNDDPGKTASGVAYIFVNGKDYSPQGRGHNVVTVDAETGAVLGAKSFDTYADPNSGENLRDHLNAINGNKIVLVAIQDVGSTYVTPAVDALRRLGATDPIQAASVGDYRSSFALVGYAQSNKPYWWIVQEQNERYKGPSEISVTILLQSQQPLAGDCQDIKKQGNSQKDGMYWLNPDGGSLLNAFLAYCDMTSYNGGWTMCYTTDEYVKPKTEVTYSAQFPYGSDGYRTNCNNISFTEIVFVDHQTGSKAYFKRRTNQSITAADNYGKTAGTYGLWDGFGANNAYSYQLLICDTSFYSGFYVSGYTNTCYKRCGNWCGDLASPFFRTASTDSNYNGVAFNTNGATSLNNRLISVGLR
ncbi:hypothetical protein ACROYT_G018289 [Oculina patagonica]